MKPISQLTDDELNEEVAKLCGWKLVEGSQVCWRTDDMPPGAFCVKTDGINQLPPYLTCLNACAKMEATLTNAQGRVYVDFILQQVKGSFGAISASPRHRVKAFLLTHGFQP